MSMIHIEEEFSDEQVVTLRIDGIVNHNTISVLIDVCQHHFKENRRISLNLAGLMHICREGIDFLKEIQGKVCIVNKPDYLKFEI